MGTTIGQKIGIVRGSGTKVEYLGPLAKNRPKIALNITIGAQYILVQIEMRTQKVG